VISNLSILDHPLVRDVLAYLRLIAKPYDDVACARILAIPAWGLEPPTLCGWPSARGRNGRQFTTCCSCHRASYRFDASHAAIGNVAGLSQRAAKGYQAANGTRNSDCFDRMARNCAAREQAGPEIRSTAGGIREGMGGQERDQTTRRIPGISGLFPAGERNDSAWMMKLRAMPCS